MPFIITNKDVSEQNEVVISRFLTLLYAYYLKMDKLERIIGQPTDHPRSNVRLELLLMCASNFVLEWNRCVPQDIINEEVIRDLCNIYIEDSNLNDYISEIDSEEEIKKIVNINYDHWIWKERINPINNEFSFKL